MRTIFIYDDRDSLYFIFIYFVHSGNFSAVSSLSNASLQFYFLLEPSEAHISLSFILCLLFTQ